MAWIQLSRLTGFMYKRKIIEAIKRLVEKVAKLDFQTDSRTRGQKVIRNGGCKLKRGHCRNRRKDKIGDGSWKLVKRKSWRSQRDLRVNDTAKTRKESKSSGLMEKIMGNRPILIVGLGQDIKGSANKDISKSNLNIFIGHAGLAQDNSTGDGLDPEINGQGDIDLGFGRTLILEILRKLGHTVTPHLKN
ncbi:hypothetical protein GOBAR_AA11173 [Gossypium barbadense]|uniref:Uncharacterized protein n=1 Tax=Gossypium barbadense TaxID=3634 RepID=A0A2P5Y1I7_GOSBA|nr:hypothetical protein GOBAR_AA11173 [Gossypium barbadense]